MTLFTVSATNNLFPDINLSYHKSVAVVKMKHGKSNALNKNFISQLYKCLDMLFHDNSVKVVVLLSGLRFSFCSGLDLTESLKYSRKPAISNYLVRLSQLFMALSNLILNSPKPVVAGINGIAIGLGVQLASVCDFRVCSDLAWLYIPEMAVGGVYPTMPLLQQTGLQNTKEMLMFGKKISAESAIKTGLVDKTVEHALTEQEAVTFAESLSSIDGTALSLQRNLLRSKIYKLIIEEQRDLISYLRKAVARDSVIDRLKKLKETGNVMELAKK